MKTDFVRLSRENIAYYINTLGIKYARELPLKNARGQAMNLMTAYYDRHLETQLGGY